MDDEKWELKKRLDKVLNLKKLLNSNLNYDIRGTETLFCPFHDDNENKSAKYFESDDHLYCFKERRQFGATDFLRKFQDLALEEIADRVSDDVLMGIDVDDNPGQIDDRYKEKFDEIRRNFAKSGDLDETLSNCIQLAKQVARD